MSDLTKDIHKIISEKLIDVPDSVKEKFPSVLKQDKLSWLSYKDEGYIILAFLGEDEEKRIKKLSKKNYHPFPGLVNNKRETPSAFRFENSFNIYIEGNTVKNAYTLSLGENCTIALVDHNQIINVKEFGGEYSFVVNLAYIISYGSEINKYNYDQYLREIISYSINQWRERNVH